MEIQVSSLQRKHALDLKRCGHKPTAERHGICVAHNAVLHDKDKRIQVTKHRIRFIIDLLLDECLI
jgi:hypothetical protein